MGLPPNMRLKLPGARVGRIALPRWPTFFCRSAALRLSALRPQLKRDPLGSTQVYGPVQGS